MTRWWAGGIVQGPLGGLTITDSLLIPNVDTTIRNLNPDLWIRILRVMQPDEEGLVTLRKSALVNRACKGHAGLLLDLDSKWQKMRAAAMKAGDAHLKILLRKLTPKGGGNQARNRRTACMKDLKSMWDFMHAFSLEPTLQVTAARVLIIVSDTSTLTNTDAEVIIRGHALNFVECRYILYNSLVTALVRHVFLQTP